MRAAFRKAATFAVMFAIAAVLLAHPRREPLKYCSCGVGNEPDRTSCWSCGARL